MPDTVVDDILSPTSPTLANAVFGSAPRSRRPSTPRSPSASVSQPPQTPTHREKVKELPPIPGSAHATARSPQSAGSSKGKQPQRVRPDGKRSDSPDVETMIARTPRPRRKSSATFGSPVALARTRSNSSMAIPSSWKGLKSKDSFVVEGDGESVISDYGTLLERDESEDEEKQGDGGSESDSSIDIHTPLPHLMFRDGLLSPRSKLLPGGGTATLSLYLDEGDDPRGTVNRANSVLSVASSAGSTMTKSGIYRDPRDTQRRRTRHKDQQLLRAGMGLTTGLGWSDSEDEDAPSLLTRRLITTNSARQPSTYSSVSRAPSQLSKSSSLGSMSHAPPSYAPGLRSISRSVSTGFVQNRLSSADTDSVASASASPSADARPPLTRTRTQSNASASSIVSSGSRESSTAAQSVTSSQNAHGQVRAGGVPRPLRLPQTAGMQQNSVTRSTSVTDSRPPVALASTKIAGAGMGVSRSRTRTLSNPGSRPTHPSVSSRASTSTRVVPPRSVSTSVMAPVRSMSMSTSTLSPLERVVSNDTLSEFPLPPSSTSSSPVIPRPGLSRHMQNPSVSSSPVSTSPGTSMRVLNTVGTGLRPRPAPRTGTGMVYRNSSYSSFYETSRLSRASVASPSGKEVGVI